jgi:LuxR family maltose regulon positive regulatory protein
VALDGGANPRVNLDRLSRLMVEAGAGHPQTLSACCVHLYDLTSTLEGRTEARTIVRLVEGALGDDSLEAELLRLVSAPSVRAHEPAELALEEALAHSRYSWRGSTVVTAWLALAQVAENTHRRADAESRLIMALRIGEQLGLERPFLNFGAQGAALVQSRLGRLGAWGTFANRVVGRALERNPEASVDAFGAAHGLLTHREHELLRELPLHQTVIEIAAKQNVSANTAKTHLRSIYSKLGASDRAAAVAIARERGLL